MAIIKIRYSLEPRNRIYVKGYGFLSFAKNMGTLAKNMSNKYSQKFLDSASKTTTDTGKVASKRAIQRTAEATGDLIGNKIAEKITKKSSNKLHSQNNFKEANNEIPKERYISPEKNNLLIN